MIQIFHQIEGFKQQLKALLQNHQILNFHISIRLNNDIYVYLLMENTEIELKPVQTFIANHPTVEVRLIRLEDQDEDIYYQSIFKTEGGSINVKDSRRRFIHLLDEDDADKVLEYSKSVITFYSYKGGLGRSTALASFAMALANGAIEYQGAKVAPQKVVIIDFDLEAPGFTNYFLKDTDNPIYHNGVVEYLTDIETHTDIDIKQYMWNVDKNFAGKGEIWIMPAGNLNPDNNTEDFLKNNLSHYLEGLARLDITSPTYMVQQVRDKIIRKIQETIQPDFILIDSRTGFNDIFGITALQLSQTMIGFFGSNAQTRAGLHFFLDTLLRHPKINALIVNSILPEAASNKLFNEFERQVGMILRNIQTDGDEAALSLFKVKRHQVLELIGTNTEDSMDFKELIRHREFKDYRELFDKIFALSKDATPFVPDASLLPSTTVARTESTKVRILQKLKSQLPHLYANEQDNGKLLISFETELAENRYFFRNCMLNLFNPSLFLVVGNKGTGKSYIYESLRYPSIVKALQKKANKPADYKYHFFHLIDTYNLEFFVNTALLNVQSNTDAYFYRFWLIFIWRGIMKKAVEIDLYHSNLTYFKNIHTETEIAKQFDEINRNDEKIIAIEQDLILLNNMLRKRNQGNEFIVAIFDPLDRLIKPAQWKDRIAPLIEFWRKKPYSHIVSKLFVRKDLLDNIGNINNFRELVNRSIQIEWVKEELFAYFFTLVTSAAVGYEDFFELMKEDFTVEMVEWIRKTIAEEQQFPTEMHLLKLAATTFFGKYADIHKTDRYGEPYDWIYKNLQNADGTISIRPFIELLKYSIDHCLTEIAPTDDILPILAPKYFADGENRRKAVETYFMDLANEQGNNDLHYVFQFFESKSSENFRKISFNRDRFDVLLNTLIKKYPMTHQDTKLLADLLIQNGIVKRTHWGYSFALLYKYRLGLRG